MAHSSVITHKSLKWFWLALWLYAEISGTIESVAFISRLSLVALVLTSWGAEEAAEAKENAAQEQLD